jgi:hypothetical protein
MNSFLSRTLSIAAWLLIVAIAAPVLAFNIDSLLVKSVGGRQALDTLARVTGFRETGKVNLYGAAGKFVEIFQSPDRLYLEMIFPQYRIAQGYDGAVAWQIDLNGRVTEMTGNEKRELLAEIYFESQSDLFAGRMPAEKRYEGVVLRSDTAYHQVAFVPQGCDTIRVLFDTSSGLARFKLSDLDNTHMVTENGDFRTIAGVRVPCDIKTWATNAPIVAEFWIDTVQFNAPMDSSIFHRPPEGGKDFRFPSGTSITLPLEFTRGHVYVTAVINGRKKGKFILDSGCSADFFDSSFVAELNLPAAGGMPAKGVAGFESVRLVRSDSIQVGPLSLYGQIGGTSDLSNISHGDSLPFGGVLGYSFLSRFPMMIDYDALTLTVYDPSNFTPPVGGIEVPFTLTMQVPTVRASLLGVEGEFIVDLGNANGLLIHDRFARDHGLAERLQTAPSHGRSLSGIGGDTQLTAGVLDSLRIGGLLAESLPVLVTAGSSGMTGSQDLAGNIGNEILSRYRVLLDYEHQRLIFY